MLARYRVQYTPHAVEQLSAILDFIKKDSPPNALRMVRRIARSIDGLQIMPRRYVLIGKEPWKSQGVRSMVVAPYLVRYKVDEGKATVIILSIRHGAREFGL